MRVRNPSSFNSKASAGGGSSFTKGPGALSPEAMRQHASRTGRSVESVHRPMTPPGFVED